MGFTEPSVPKNGNGIKLVLFCIPRNGMGWEWWHHTTTPLGGVASGVAVKTAGGGVM